MPLRCGVAGLGRGKTFVERLDQQPDCEVVAVCDSSGAALADFDHLACYTDYDRFVTEAGLDVVAVITPGPVHAEQSVLAMENGAHVLCETPCVYSLEEAEAVVGTAKRTGLKFMLAEDYIFQGVVQHWKALVDDGKFGEIVFAEGEYTHDCRNIMFLGPDGRYVPHLDRDKHDGVHPTWRATDLPPLKYCSHTLGPLLYLMEDRCVSACGLATGSKTLPDLPTDDVQVGIFKTTKGSVLRLTNGFSIAHPYGLSLGLYGTRGSVKFMRIGGSQVKIYTDEQPDAGWQDWDIQWSERPDGLDWLNVMIEGFIDSVRTNGDAPIDVCQSMDYTVPGICATMSAETDGQPIAVPDYRVR